MIVFLSSILEKYNSGFHLFQYITFRAIAAVLTSLFISLMLGPRVIVYLNKIKAGQSIRSIGPATHLSKEGTPTMGGILILLSIVISTLLWANLDNHYIWVVLFTLISFALIGFVDDYKKIIYKSSDGLSGRQKYMWQSIFALIAIAALYFLSNSPIETTLIIPFVKQASLQMGIFYVVFSYLVVVGTSNAVNLTDGLDGLATLPIVLVAAGLGVFAYASGHAEFSRYLAIPAISNVGELSIICSCIVGAGLGFLWFNTYPAQVFMGDVGSLSLGATLGIIAVIVRQEIILFIMGGVFVAETVSVILQVASYKLSGKRIFKMAPLHHHFELLGWEEPKIIVRVWIITFILILIGLASLKIR